LSSSIDLFLFLPWKERSKVPPSPCLTFDLAILDRGRRVAHNDTSESFAYEIPTHSFLSLFYPTNSTAYSNNRRPRKRGRVQRMSANRLFRWNYDGLVTWRFRNHFPIRPPRPRFAPDLAKLGAPATEHPNNFTARCRGLSKPFNLPTSHQR
jgi:hypothetical protein